MKKLVLTSILFLFTGTLVFAQEITKKCGSTEAQEEVFQMYPELRESYEAYVLLQNSKVKPTSNGQEKSTAQYVIPVVFHILHQYGSENISDAQVYDAMKVINREFNAADPDSVDVVSAFDTLIGNAKIEFKLAAIDPFGNCTNGIEHIYSHETLIGDAFSKLHQWNRSRYLNIWVVKIVGQAGAAAYALKPASTDGSGFWMDGIVSNHTYVGSIGTASPFVESTLTHEIGHYLSLSHTWGDTNDPGVACGDDGVSDTPVTKGWTSCPLGSSDFCNAGIQEDLQNYMEYAYCDRHYTPGQVVFMHNALEGIAGQRSNLWKDETLIATGVKNLTLPQDPSNTLTVPLCKPVADFSSNYRIACLGTPIQFNDASWNAVIDTYEWTFEGATPATSTSKNPLVTFNSNGYKRITLKVTNAAGSDTKSMNAYVYVAPDWADFVGPKSLNLENNEQGLFIVQNPEENYAMFNLVSGNGYNGSKAFKLNNYKNVANADPFTDDAFYKSRLGKSVDNLITPSFDLANTSGITVTFKYAYATNATIPADITEVLKVYSSRNCGETWSPRLTLTSTQLVSAGYASNSDFAPTNNAMWKEGSFTYSSTSLDYKTRFKFEFTASDVASNLYIDEININGTLGLMTEEIALLDLNVFPNPLSNGKGINVSYTAQNEPVQFILRDVQGKVISSQVFNTPNAQVETELENTQNLPASCYFLEVRTGDSSTTRKVVVL